MEPKKCRRVSGVIWIWFNLFLLYERKEELVQQPHQIYEQLCIPRN